MIYRSSWHPGSIREDRDEAGNPATELSSNRTLFQRAPAPSLLHTLPPEEAPEGLADRNIEPQHWQYRHGGDIQADLFLRCLSGTIQYASFLPESWGKTHQ